MGVRGRIIVAAVLLLGVWCGLAGATGPLVVTGHPHYPPFSWREGDRLVGVGPELAAIILQRLEIPFTTAYMGPWKRVQEIARHGQADLLVDIYHNLDRQGYLDYSIPYCTDPTSVFTVREKPFAVADRRDLIGRHGVTLFGDSFGESMDRFIDQHLRLTRVYSPKEMLDTLLNGKADYLLMGYYMVRIYAGRQGVEHQLRVVQRDLVVENMYMAFSRASAFGHLLPRINDQIRRLQGEGRIEQLINTHLARYLKENPP